jgi:hypothetical protein
VGCMSAQGRRLRHRSDRVGLLEGSTDALRTADTGTGRRESLALSVGAMTKARAHVERALNPSEPGRAKKVTISKSAIPMPIETSAILKIQMNPSFDALNTSITAPNRMRSRAFPMAPAMMKANPTRA